MFAGVPESLARSLLDGAQTQVGLLRELDKVRLRTECGLAQTAIPVRPSVRTMTIARGSFTVVPDRPTARRLGRELAAKAGDLLPLCDFAGLLLAGYFSVLIYHAFAASAVVPLYIWSELYRLVWIAAGLAPFILYELRFASFAGAGDNAALVRGFASRFLMFLGVVCAIAFAGRWLDYTPRGWLVLWLVCALFLTATSRMLLALYLRRLTGRGALAESVAVVGEGPLADALIPLLRKSTVLFGVFDDHHRRRTAACLHRPESTVENLIARASAAGASKSDRPDRIVIALPATAERRLLSIVERLRPLGIPLELSPQNLRLQARGIAHVGVHVADCLPVTLLADRPIKRWNAVLKSAEDVVLGWMVMVLLLPVLACIALAIKLDSPGPVVFKQRRHGFNNREFDIYKFRTMRCAPDDSGNLLRQTIRGDCRITRIGRFLRKFSLDELPKVFNVLEGDMSLVGPRPHAVNMRTEERLGHEITNVYAHRHRVKPGITGWSQVNGSRGATDTIEKLHRRVELDLYYVENWSLLFDLKILFLTPKEVLRATNAY